MAYSIHISLLYNAFYLYFRHTEIYQETYFKPGCGKIIEALGHVDFIEEFHRLQFEKNCMFNENIGNILTYHNTVIVYFDFMLLVNVQSAFPHFMSQCIFIYFFKESTPETIAYSKCTSNNLFCYFVQLCSSVVPFLFFDLIRVCPCSSVVPFF